MLVTLNDVLYDAQKKQYAVGLFNTINLEMAKAVLSAAEEARSPVIIGSAEILLGHCSIQQLSEMLLPMIRRASVPVVLHYDHGLTYERVIEALRCGFSSVMYDCSSDSYEQNIARCAEMTRIAHAFGATIEGELGHVGSGAGSAEAAEESQSFYTNPNQAKDYLKRTGVDALAVAIGSAHGPYMKKPQLDLKRLAEIRSQVSVPLVLHGGSGLSDQDFRSCIMEGICKINIFTDLDRAGKEGVEEALRCGANYLTDLTPYSIRHIKQCVLRKMELFGCAGKV